MNKRILLGAALAGVVSAQVSIAQASDKAAPAAAAKEVTGECHGTNACKGQGACGGEGHACKGKNECKGKGWTSMSEKACTEKKGTFKPGKA